MTRTPTALDEYIHKDKSWNTIEKELAGTYLKTMGKPGRKKRPSFRTKIPWIVAAVALCAALAAFYFSSNIDIKIRVASGAAFIDKENPANLMPEDGVFLVKGAEPNKAVIKSALLSGDASRSSHAAGEEITLCNGGGQGWADYKMEFVRPVNLKGLNIRYAARGEAGGERLVLMIIDSDGRAARIEDEVSSKLEKGWNVYTINFGPVRDSVDLTRVSAIKFEFGAMTTGNYYGATMYLKDVQVIRNRRLKWL